MFQVLVGIISAFVGVSVHGAIARQYFERDSIDFPSYIANCLYILIGSSILIGILLIIFSHPISTITEFPKEWLWSVLIAAATNFIIIIVATLWQVRVMPVHYGTFLLTLMILNIGLSVWFVVVLDAGWRGRLLGQILAYIIFAIIGIIILQQGGWLKCIIKKNISAMH